MSLDTCPSCGGCGKRHPTLRLLWECCACGLFYDVFRWIGLTWNKNKHKGGVRAS